MIAYNANAQKLPSEDQQASGDKAAAPMAIESNAKSSASKKQPARWPTTFWQQVSILTGRSFRQNRGNVWTAVNFLQSFAVALIVGGAWFQTGLSEVSSAVDGHGCQNECAAGAAAAAVAPFFVSSRLGCTGPTLVPR